jgi:hypothetical protein
MSNKDKNSDSKEQMWISVRDKNRILEEVSLLFQVMLSS